jgi:hypothetical protein
MKQLLIIVLLLYIVLPLAAQDATPVPTTDPVTIAPLIFDREISDSITDGAIFDRFTFNAREGDRITATITPDETLAPLIGIADASGNVIARSDADADSEITQEVAPGEMVVFNYDVPADGEYALVVSRAGLADGDTTGAYSLLVTRINPLENSLQAVQFRCEEPLATTVMTLGFTGLREESYQINVYGLDGFQPAIRAVAGPQSAVDVCSTDAQQMGGHEVRFPDEEPFVIEAEAPDAAQLTLNGGRALAEIALQIGSIDGQPGRYMMVIDGFNVSRPGEVGAVTLRIGPAVVDTDTLVYMVRGERTRLDPMVALEDEDAELIAMCDDAGRGDCAAVPALDGGVILSDARHILGDRLDAGVRVAPGDVSGQFLLFYGRNANVIGDYAIVFIGELPE